MQKMFFLYVIFLHVANVDATFIDNRFFPFFPENYKRTYDKRSNIDSNLFFMFANESRDDTERNVGLFEIFGKYNLTKIANSLEATGRPNPLKPEWQSARSIEFGFLGKLETQGYWFAQEYALIKNRCKTLSFGSRFAIMHVNLRQSFIIGEEIQKQLHLEDGGKLELDRERRLSSKLLGLTGECWSTTGITDLDLYARFGFIQDYICKCKQIDTGWSLGALVPSGQLRDINNSASFPFSDNGHWGIYAIGDVTVELKEDWFVGAWIDLLHRFPKTEFLRMPYNAEPYEFGALTGNFKVTPGFTFGMSIFFKILDFNNGLGGKIKYTFIKHMRDSICDMRSDKITYPFTFTEVLRDSTGWMSEYITVEIIYDLRTVFNCVRFDPYLYVNFDAPIHGVGEANVAKTFKLSFGLEVNF